MRDVSLTEESLIRRTKDTASRLFEKQMLVITVDDSMLHRFNETGTFIWECIEQPCSIKTLLAMIEGHFDGFEKKRDSHDVYGFLHELLKKGLITSGGA